MTDPGVRSGWYLDILNELVKGVEVVKVLLSHAHQTTIPSTNEDARMQH